MTVADLFEQVDVQGEVKIVYVKEDVYDRIQIDRERAENLEIQFMYCENDIMYIEVEFEVA